MTRGVWLGVDLGSARIGVAVCDPDRALATPLRTIAVTSPQAALDELVELVEQADPEAVAVGLPRHLSGAEGAASRQARRTAEQLAARVPTRQVFLVDERLTTVDAHRRLRGSGRTARTSREVVDQAAAVLILQTTLDRLAATGLPGGELVSSGGKTRKPRMKDQR